MSGLKSRLIHHLEAKEWNDDIAGPASNFFLDCALFRTMGIMLLGITALLRKR
jgi:hypothetical protein